MSLTTPTRIRSLQRKLYRKAKAEPAYRFYLLYDKICREDGPSYRAHPRLYLGVFHCGAQNSDAIGGTADIDWSPASIASEAYDPLRNLGGQNCCAAQRGL